MKILLINYEYPPIGAGAANATYHLADELTKAGHSVTVLTSSYKKLTGAKYEDGIKVVRVRSLRRHPNKSGIFEMLSFVLSSLLQLRPLVRTFKPDIAIIFFLFPCGILGLPLKVFHKIKYLISLRGSDVPGTEKGLIRLMHIFLSPIRNLIIKNASCITANSKGLKLIAEKSCKKNITVIPNGVNYDLYTPSATNDKKEYTFIFAGRLHKQKNLHFVIDTFSKLNSSIEYKFLIIGTGPEENTLKQFVKKLCLNENIIFSDWLEKDILIERYRKSSCMILFSEFEGMSNSLLEGMSCGIPAIVSDIPQNTELIQDNVNGLIATKDSLQVKIEDIISHPDKAKKLGENARRTIINNYSWKKTALAHLDIIDNINKESCY